MWDQYTWVFALSFFVAFACAFGIGANDVANSFGTSVGAKAITIAQACVIAGICEFLGAVLLGASVTDTIKSNIAKVALFQDTPELLLFGMFLVMCCAAIWDNLCCHLEFSVSTTHTTIGAIMGMAIAMRGFRGVVWSRHAPTFPFVTGLTPVFLSWVLSPTLSGIGVLILYGIILRPFVLRSKHSFQRALFVMPLGIGLTFFIVVLFIIQTGNKNKTWDTPVTDGKACWISAIPAVSIAAVVALVGVPLVRKNILGKEAAQIAKMEAGQKTETIMVDGKPVQGVVTEESVPDLTPAAEQGWFKRHVGGLMAGRLGSVVHVVAENRVVRTITYGARFDCHSVVQEGHKDYDMHTAAVWENCETFDLKTEAVFRYLQVFSACVMSFAHGANDVANAMGPFSAVYNIWSNRGLQITRGRSQSQVPTWILVIGGAGIVFGLATYGYKIMRLIGVKAARLSNSRGFCAELSTATVVMVASRYGLPISTTQTIMGAILAIGLFEGIKGVNWRVFLRTFCAWVLTIVVVTIFSCGLTSFIMYAPQKTGTDDIRRTSYQLGTSAVAMMRELQGPLAQNAQWQALNGTLNDVFFRSPNVLRESLATYNQVVNLFAASTNLPIPAGNITGALP